jgi:dephospho-CoA kinase
MQKAKVMAAADYTIMNDSSLKELNKQLDLFLHSLKDVK